jgi:hypothetical protein
LNFWRTSKTAPHFEHLYSYNGIVDLKKGLLIIPER